MTAYVPQNEGNCHCVCRHLLRHIVSNSLDDYCGKYVICLSKLDNIYVFNTDEWAYYETFTNYLINTFNKESILKCCSLIQSCTCCERHQTNKPIIGSNTVKSVHKSI